jgi:hypothetical protein
VADPTVRRRRLGAGLIGGGILIIAVSVIVVLEIANGPGTGPKSFAQRRGYDQVKQDVHRSFPIALLGGLLGLAIAMTGARIRGQSQEVDGSSNSRGG